MSLLAALSKHQEWHYPNSHFRYSIYGLTLCRTTGAGKDEERSPFPSRYGGRHLVHLIHLLLEFSNTAPTTLHSDLCTASVLLRTCSTYTAMDDKIDDSPRAEHIHEHDNNGDDKIDLESRDHLRKLTAAELAVEKKLKKKIDVRPRLLIIGLPWSPILRRPDCCAPLCSMEPVNNLY